MATREKSGLVGQASLPVGVCEAPPLSTLGEGAGGEDTSPLSTLGEGGQWGEVFSYPAFLTSLSEEG